ncbi:uncharacterized protein E6C27_scaffold190G00650 [Cucumis melo var. makuwa]|uniref:DUF659 domain-containing protein n=1 Tax=Cucumis melo var. makuwa TaxID=1194695 RepID=A0A5A7UEN1_CUCMM|nr:uncharacterized protein E6C27_scaffold190G00650 [Cucumis melo var. makuwa]
MADESSKKDLAWKYGRLQNDQDINTFVYGFCSKVTKGGVYRLKQHLVGGYRNAIACKKCSDHVKEEIRDYMSKKKEIKEQRNLIVDIDVQDYGMEDEDEGSISVNNRATSSGSSLKKPRQKGPMDAFFTLNPESVVQNRKNDKGKQTSLNAAYKKEMREHTIQRIARWFYDAGVPLNACTYDIFAPLIESIGQFGPGLKPPTYHELRVPCLKKELEATNELMSSHKAEWAKVGCTIMPDGWTDRRNRTLINFLVNSPKGTMFIESIDASSYVKDGKKMFELLDNFVEALEKQMLYK